MQFPNTGPFSSSIETGDGGSRTLRRNARAITVPTRLMAVRMAAPLRGGEGVADG